MPSFRKAARESWLDLYTVHMAVHTEKENSWLDFFQVFPTIPKMFEGDFLARGCGSSAAITGIEKTYSGYQYSPMVLVHSHDENLATVGICIGGGLMLGLRVKALATKLFYYLSFCFFKWIFRVFKWFFWIWPEKKRSGDVHFFSAQSLLLFSFLVLFPNEMTEPLSLIGQIPRKKIYPLCSLLFTP